MYCVVNSWELFCIRFVLKGRLEQETGLSNHSRRTGKLFSVRTKKKSFVSPMLYSTEFSLVNLK